MTEYKTIKQHIDMPGANILLETADTHLNTLITEGWQKDSIFYREVFDEDNDAMLYRYVTLKRELVAGASPRTFLSTKDRVTLQTLLLAHQNAKYPHVVRGAIEGFIESEKTREGLRGLAVGQMLDLLGGRNYEIAPSDFELIAEAWSTVDERCASIAPGAITEAQGVALINLAACVECALFPATKARRKDGDTNS